MKNQSQCSVFILSIVVSACNAGANTTDSTSSSTSPSSSSSSTGTSADTTPTTSESSGTTAACTGTTSLVGECDVGCQNCSATEKCVAFGEQGKEFDQTACRPLPEAPKAPGEGCTILVQPMSGMDDCQRGSTCVAFPLFANSQCLEFCKSDGDSLQCPDPATRCVNLYGRAVCAPVCDPRKPGECDQDCRALNLECPGCFPFTDSGTFTCWYPPPEEIGAGFPCPFGECVETLFCGPPGRVPGCDEATPCCTPYCDLTNPNCSEGTDCQPVFEMGQAPQGLESLGACLTPS